MTKKYMKELAVAEIYDVKVKTLQNWRWQGKGPKFCRIGRAIRYSMDDVLEFMEKNRVKVVGQ